MKQNSLKIIYSKITKKLIICKFGKNQKKKKKNIKEWFTYY